MKTPRRTIQASWTIPGLIALSAMGIGACAQQTRSNTEFADPTQPRLPIEINHADDAGVEEPEIVLVDDTDQEPIEQPPFAANPVSKESTDSVGPSDSAEDDEIELALEETSVDELSVLYRRLHDSLGGNARSELIAELLGDRRSALRDLGFELAHRNLSARTVLSDLVGQVTSGLIRSPDAGTRAQAAGLLTRLVTPDAMVLLTEALNIENDPLAAKPLLLGISRWPNEDAADAVVRWCVRHDSAFDAATTAAWAMETEGLLGNLERRDAILDAVRSTPPAGLSSNGMMLLARMGDEENLRELELLLTHENPEVRERAGNALVQTERAMDILVRAAVASPGLYSHAADSLTLYNASVEGFQILSRLNAPTPEARTRALLRIGNALPVERLDDAVTGSTIEDTLAIKLLERLLTIETERSQAVLQGIVLLAQLELRIGDADGALSIADAIAGDEQLGTKDKELVTGIRQRAAIMLGMFDHPSLLDSGPSVWLEMLGVAGEESSKQGIAGEIRARFPDQLTKEQELLVEATPIIESSEDRDDTPLDKTDRPVE